MVTEFFMRMIPPTTTHQQKKVTEKNSTIYFYEPEKLKAARQKLMAYLSQHVPDKTYNCGIRVIVKWCFPTTKKYKNGMYKITKPDIDNLQKLLYDCMSDLKFWKDDQLVASVVHEKFHADITGIYIRIEEL